MLLLCIHNLVPSSSHVVQCTQEHILMVTSFILLLCWWLTYLEIFGVWKLSNLSDLQPPFWIKCIVVKVRLGRFLPNILPLDTQGGQHIYLSYISWHMVVGLDISFGIFKSLGRWAWILLVFLAFLTLFVDVKILDLMNMCVDFGNYLRTSWSCWIVILHIYLKCWELFWFMYL